MLVTYFETTLVDLIVSCIYTLFYLNKYQNNVNLLLVGKLKWWMGYMLKKHYLKYICHHLIDTYTTLYT